MASSDDLSGCDGPGKQKATLRCCEQTDDLVQLYKALAHPVRLMILRKLAAEQQHCCGDICSELPLAQSTVSQHLKVLREAGFIALQTCGQQSHYTLNEQGIALMQSRSDLFFQSLRSLQKMR